MNSKIKILLFLSFISFNWIEAQEVVKKDTIAGTEYSIAMDKEVNKVLEDLENKCTTVKGNPIPTDNSNSGSIKPTNGTVKTPPKINIPTRPPTNYEICAKNPRIMGYKIQLAVVKSNKEAVEVGAYFRRRFPNMKVEIDASFRPNYKVYTGSYFTKDDTKRDLANVKKYFPSALPVQYRIFCEDAL